MPRKKIQGFKKTKRGHFQAKHNLGQYKRNIESSSFLQKFGVWRTREGGSAGLKESAVQTKKFMGVKIPIRPRPWGLLSAPGPDTNVHLPQPYTTDSATARIRNSREEPMSELSASSEMQEPEIRGLKGEVAGLKTIILAKKTESKSVRNCSTYRD